MVIIRTHTLLLLLPTVAVLFASQVVAQSQEKFFPHDYAKTPIENDRQLKEKEGDSFSLEKEEKISPYTDLLMKALPKNEEQPPLQIESSSEAEVSALPNNTPGIPIKWIGAVLATQDQQHFQNSVNDLIMNSDKYDLSLGEITLVGPPKGLSGKTDLIMALTVREAGTSFRSKPPEEYKIERSPTWIIGTAEGEILLEGAGPLSRFLNDKGEFVPPEIPEQPKSETATKAEGQKSP